MIKKVSLTVVMLVYATWSLAAQAQDPLPSWVDSKAKNNILAFVESVTNQQSPDFIPVEERIAVFDNDGTLWSEQPMYFQFMFILDLMKNNPKEEHQLQSNTIFKAILDNDLTSLAKLDHKKILELMNVTHTNMTEAEFNQLVFNWIQSAKHPTTGKLYKDMVYKPMLELLDYLRAQGFKTYIVSGGGMAFLRVWAQEVYGVPPEQVIGSSLKIQFSMKEGKPEFMRLPQIHSINDKETKPVHILQHIGRQPVIAVGNSDGDLAMIQWTTGTSRKGLGIIVHHTDEQREWAYDRVSHVGKLNKALDEAQQKGWTVIDMKNDWSVIYP